MPCISHNGPRRPEVSYLSPTTDAASQRITHSWSSNIRTESGRSLLPHMWGKLENMHSSVNTVWEIWIQTEKRSAILRKLVSTWRKVDIQLCDKHLIYSVLIFRYWTVISEYSASLSKILKFFFLRVYLKSLDSV